jgi:hypothetical protein
MQFLLVLPQLPRERESRVTENAISARAAIYCFLQSTLGRGEMIYIFICKNCAAIRNRVKFEENIMPIAKESAEGSEAHLRRKRRSRKLCVVSMKSRAKNYWAHTKLVGNDIQSWVIISQ